MAPKNKKPLDVPGVVPEGTVRDFLLPIVEFLGILVPGLLFLLISIPAILLPLAQALDFLQIGDADPQDSFTYVLDLVKSSSIGLSGIVLVLSYVAGHILFRQDPKIPDEFSFGKVPEDQKKSGPVRISDAEILDNKEKNVPSPEKHNLEFPYRYLVPDRKPSSPSNEGHLHGFYPSEDFVKTSISRRFSANGRGKVSIQAKIFDQLSRSFLTTKIVVVNAKTSERFHSETH